MKLTIYSALLAMQRIYSDRSSNCNRVKSWRKPEPLRENLSGLWSRRIDEANRMVYEVSDEYLTIVACRFHY
jgi:Txe/YoeB family toxin of toxin-antitoxin system